MTPSKYIDFSVTLIFQRWQRLSINVTYVKSNGICFGQIFKNPFLYFLGTNGCENVSNLISCIHIFNQKWGPCMLK